MKNRITAYFSGNIESQILELFKNCVNPVQFYWIHIKDSLSDLLPQPNTLKNTSNYQFPFISPSFVSDLENEDDQKRIKETLKKNRLYEHEKRNY